jgi:hypothetical protein
MVLTDMNVFVVGVSWAAEKLQVLHAGLSDYTGSQAGSTHPPISTVTTAARLSHPLFV